MGRIRILVLVCLVAILGTRLCSIWDDLGDIDNAAASLALTEHWCHHTLREVVRLGDLIGHHGLRTARVVVGHVSLVRAVARP